jgi:nucleotide-binding universal stress UspA family protein
MKYSASSALDDFREARWKASLHEVLARLTRQPANLLSYDEVRQKLKAQAGSERGLREIPLQAIVGSVNRYDDFTRNFLPRSAVDAIRWARVKTAVTDLEGLPPIEVYQIGETYFVQDGNHRVSVARDLGASTIQAYVTEVRTSVPLTPDIRPEDLILKAEYASFLDQIPLHTTRPKADLTVTAPGQYRAFEEHIAVHRYYMGQDLHREISLGEAAAHWYDHVYLPVVELVRRRKLLKAFPRRTEADLYLWLSAHRAALEQELGWSVSPGAAARNLAERFSPTPEHAASRLGEAILDAVIPASLEPGPRPGTWRSQREDNLFGDLLVPVGMDPSGLAAIDQALVVANKEQARIHGLHVAANRASKASPETQALAQRFEQRCAEAGVLGDMSIAVGSITRHIVTRSDLNDLIVFQVSYPPLPRPQARYQSGLRAIIHHSSTPVLAIPSGAPVSPFSQALMAFDASPKSLEALFLGAYLAEKWGLHLNVLTIQEEKKDAIEAQAIAQRYLFRRDIQARYRIAPGAVAPAMMQHAQAWGCDVILMGGYGRGPWLTLLFDEVVDQVLREARCPVLICQ